MLNNEKGRQDQQLQEYLTKSKTVLTRQQSKENNPKSMRDTNITIGRSKSMV